MTPHPSTPGPECTGPDARLWDWRLDVDPPETPRHAAGRHREAQAICRQCRIRALCLADRETNPSLGAGVWGGELFGSAA